MWLVLVGSSTGCNTNLQALGIGIGFGSTSVECQCLIYHGRYYKNINHSCDQTDGTMNVIGFDILFSLCKVIVR